MFDVRVSIRRSIVYLLGAAGVICMINTAGSTRINLLLIPLIYLFFSYTVFSVSYQCGIVYTLIFYILFAGGREAAFELFYRLIASAVSIVIPSWFSIYGLPYLIAEYVLAFVFLKWIIRYTGRLEITGKKSFCWYLLILPVVSLIILISCIYMDNKTLGHIERLLYIGALLLYISNACIFVILERSLAFLDEIQWMRLSHLKQDMEQENYQVLKKANSVYRKYLHDMHMFYNQFRNLALAGECDKIVSIVDQQEGRLQIEEAGIIYCGDTVLNVLLTEYAGRGKKAGIEVEIHVQDNLYLDFISDNDKISMFGNLLSNSLEAASQCRKGEGRITVNVHMGNDYLLVFQISNTCHAKLKQKGHRFLTTKEDRDNHGFGIKIVEELAESYGGSLMLEIQDGYFTAVLMVSNHKTCQNRKF